LSLKHGIFSLQACVFVPTLRSSGYLKRPRRITSHTTT
jgi:hypothetical protein